MLRERGAVVEIGKVLMIGSSIAAVVVAVVLFGALYAWIRVAMILLNVAAAKDVLDRFDARVAKLPPDEREQVRAQPPVAVLEARLALPSRRFQLSHPRSVWVNPPG
jgi:hypothetical protein